jgi:hypothetical protein
MHAFCLKGLLSVIGPINREGTNAVNRPGAVIIPGNLISRVNNAINNNGIKGVLCSRKVMPNGVADILFTIDLRICGRISGRIDV